MIFNFRHRLLYSVLLLSVPTAVIAAYYTSWWWLVAGFVWSTVINTLFVQIGLHRYFSHAGFKTGTWRHRFLTIGSFLAGGGTPISWTVQHLQHHAHSDNGMDLHSPVHGFFHSALLWPLQGKDYFESKQQTITPKHLVRDSTVMWVHQHYFHLWAVSIITVGMFGWQPLLFMLLFPAGGSILRGNMITNTLTHMQLPGSYRNFNTPDQSYNNQWIQFFQIGEGLHNNHHHNMRNYNQAMMPGERDPAAWIIERFFKV